MSDPINSPDHYTQGPKCPTCGAVVECITVTELMGFVLGNVVKYIWRAGKKDPKRELEDLKKAQWYLDHEIKRREANHVKA